MESQQQANKIKLFVMQNQKELMYYGAFFLTVLFVYHLFSDGDFSFLLTLASMVSCASFLMVAVCIESEKNVGGISLKMMECYLVLLAARLFAIVPFEGYLPFDRTGDWFYQVIETVILTLSGSIVYLCRTKYASTYRADSDYFDHRFVIGPAAVIALILHPSLNDFVPSDICWAFALYVESVASLPQLFMFQKEGQVHRWTAHFLAAQATSKLISFLFWASSFSELHSHQHVSQSINPLKSFVGYWVLAIQGFQLLVMGDFCWQYAKCVSKGVPVEKLLTEV